jgi:4-hydroxy-3-polyprenylbenzoate decarboxylase
MWKLFNNIDASRDMVFYEDKIGIDATKKLKEEGLTRDWPDEINMSDDIKMSVDRRWNEYGIN